MASKHRVEAGECISSIAFAYGFLPQTIWDHPDNADLRALRTDPHVLMEGDMVVIPDLITKSVTVESGRRHIFVVKGVPEKLRVRLLDHRDRPRANLPCTVEVDGLRRRQGKTDADGIIEVPILPSARLAHIEIQGDGGTEVHELRLGHLDPLDSVTGIQARLTNLGFFCGAIDGEMGPLTRAAIRAFQSDCGLPPTGEVDDDLLDAFFNMHDHKER